MDLTKSVRSSLSSTNTTTTNTNNNNNEEQQQQQQQRGTTTTTTRNNNNNEEQRPPSAESVSTTISSLIVETEKVPGNSRTKQRCSTYAAVSVVSVSVHTRHLIRLCRSDLYPVPKRHHFLPQPLPQLRRRRCHHLQGTERAPSHHRWNPTSPSMSNQLPHPIRIRVVVHRCL